MHSRCIGNDGKPVFANVQRPAKVIFRDKRSSICSSCAVASGDDV